MPEPDSSPESATRARLAWLRDRLFPRGTNLLSWTSYVIILIMMVFYVLDPAVPHDKAYYGTVLALAALLILNVLWHDIRELFRTRFSADLSILAATILLTFFVTWAGQIYNTIYLIFMIAAQANAMLPPAPALLLSLAAAGGWVGILFILGIDPANLPSLLYGMAVGLVFTITFSQVVRRYSEQTERANQLLEQLTAANAELVAARARETELAIAQERVRVARDLHDGLGHHLTALSIQLQALEKLAAANPAQAAEAARNARSEAQAALKEVRQSVAALREAPVDLDHLPDAIRRLVEDTGARAGLIARFEQVGAAARLPIPAAMTLFRTTQEGLTNIQKHAAGATQVSATLAYSAEQVSLRIWNDGQTEPGADCAPGQITGYGIAGLRERAALLGGRLDCGPDPQGGFRLLMTLPCEGETA